jgi:hypothetical protein
MMVLNPGWKDGLAGDNFSITPLYMVIQSNYNCPYLI